MHATGDGIRFSTDNGFPSKRRSGDGTIVYDPVRACSDPKSWHGLQSEDDSYALDVAYDTGREDMLPRCHRCAGLQGVRSMKPARKLSNSSRIMGRLRRQAGFTLMEAMISLALSLVVTSAMVALMANSLGTTSRIIQMSQLTDELRNTMSMLTRDIRRANIPQTLPIAMPPDCDEV
jgi:hypothetical protein